MNLFEDEIAGFASLLNKNGVKYILVGGLAVNYHGYSRSTGDVDLWLEDSEENRKRLVNALTEFGIKGAEAFLTYPLIAGFAEILLDNGIYIDLMAQMIVLKQVDFAESLDQAEDLELKENVHVKVLHINHLIKEKESSGRDKDLQDARKLRELQQNKLN